MMERFAPILAFPRKQGKEKDKDGATRPHPNLPPQAGEGAKDDEPMPPSCPPPQAGEGTKNRLLFRRLRW
jgi:hypothetical protein